MADTQARQTAAQPPPRSRASRVFLRPREFWRRLTAGLEAEALWRQFATEAREGYGLYSRDVDWESKQASHWRRGDFHCQIVFLGAGAENSRRRAACCSSPHLE